jgi:hypothetical protein
MARVRGLLCPVGIHQARGGLFHATPERLQRYVQQFRAMKAADNEVPVCWGHQPDAKPGDAKARAELDFWKSKFRAGKVHDLDYDAKKKALFWTGDVEGAENKNGKLLSWTKEPSSGRLVRTEIGEVSAAIHKFTDGQGLEFPDALTHVALCVLPIVKNQPGLHPVELAALPAEGIWLSTGSFVRELAGDPKMPLPKGDEKITETEEKPADDLTTPDPPIPDVAPAPPPDPLAADDGCFAEFLNGLKELGLSMPAGTTKENVFERGCVAMHALKHKETMKGEDNADAGTDAGGGGGQVVEEQRPMMMSAEAAQDPAVKILLAREQTAHKKKQIAVIESLKAKGKMPVHEADKLLASYEGYQMAWDDKGEPVQQKADAALEIWLSVTADIPTGHLGGKKPKLKVARRPIERDEEARLDKDVVDRLTGGRYSEIQAANNGKK